MRHPRLTHLGLLLLLPATGCMDRDLATGPAYPGDALHAISDGAHDGTEGFYFLPPMVKKPAYSGAFDATLSPVVEICESPVCDAIHASFSMTDGFGSELVRLDEDAEHYKVNWHTDQTGTEVGQTYRVRVSVAGAVLGYADIEMAGNGRDARNTTTDGVIGLVDGRTLPIAFRIEEGSALVVGPDGGIFELLKKAVMVEIPQGALEENINLSAYAASDEMSDPDVVPELVFEFLPSPYSFNRPVIVTIAFDPDRLPAGIAAQELRLLALVDDEWVQLPGSSVDVATSTVSGPLDSFSRKAVGRGKVHTITVIPADASLEVGEMLQFEATVTNVDGEEMDRSLQWSSDNADVATVDNTGLAAAVAPGEATIEARAGNVRGSTVLTVEDSPAGLEIQAQTISGGHRHGCGVAASGQGVCWGSAFWGVDEFVGDPENPRDVTMPPGVLFASINASEHHTVALSSTGDAYAWGANASGQLGNETFVSSNIPVKVKMPEGVKFVSVQAGNGFSVALSTTGEAWGWGNGANGSGAVSNVPVRVAQPGSVSFVSISAYASFTVALTDGGFVYTWGANNEGQLGIGGRTPRFTPVLVNMSGVSIASVSAGQHHAVAVATTGEVYAWGRNSSGQLGNNSLTLSERPVTVIMPEGVTFAAVSAGGNHNIAISPTGIAYGWGFNGQGQVGTGPATVSRVPTLVSMPPGVDSFVAIATGNSFSMALTPSGQLYTWGRNVYYELADGTRENRFTPVLAVGGRLFAR